MIHRLFCTMMLISNLALATDNVAFFDSIISQLMTAKLGNNVVAKMVVDLSDKQNANAYNEVLARQTLIDHYELEKFSLNDPVMSIKFSFPENEHIIVKGTYNISYYAFVLNRYIKAGTLINSADVVRTYLHEIIDLDPYIIHDSDLIGKRPKKDLKANTLVRKSDLINLPLVKINDTVNLKYTKDAVDISITGVALSNGEIGDVIQVLVPHNRIINGQITGDRTLQVEDE